MLLGEEERVAAHHGVMADNGPWPDDRAGTDVDVDVHKSASHHDASGLQARLRAHVRAGMHEGRHLISRSLHALRHLQPGRKVVVSDRVHTSILGRWMRAHDLVKRTQHIWPGMNVVNEATEEMSPSAIR